MRYQKNEPRPIKASIREGGNQASCTLTISDDEYSTDTLCAALPKMRAIKLPNKPFIFERR